MSPVYDMCVDGQSLSDIQTQLNMAARSLENIEKSLDESFIKTRGKLEGYQFEKSRKMNDECKRGLQVAEHNIESGIKYVGELQILLDEYLTKCKYDEG